MKILISNTSDTPLYQQIKDQITDAILKGELKEGDPLPSIRSFANDLRVSVLTIRRVYDDLEKDSPFSELQYHLTSGGYITENTRGAVIHESLAAQNGLQIGDKLELSGENGDTVSVTITGLFRSAGRIEDKQPAAATAVNRIENQIFIDNETCKELLKDSSYYQLSI